jgi:hypothetical protein
MKTKEETTPVEIRDGVGNYNFDALLSLDTETEEEEENTELQLNIEGEQQEEEQEEQQEEEQAVAPEKEEGTPLEAEKSSVYSRLTKKYIEMGTWQDAKIELNGEEVTLSELENLDEETFLQIQQSQDTVKDEDLKDKYINKEELDDISLQIVEISKNKGDLSRVLDVKKRFIDPLEKFDLTQESHQEALVRQKYLIESNNKLSQKDLDIIIKNRKEDLTLDKEAQEYADGLKSGFKQFLQQEEDKAKTEIETTKETVKTTKKSVRDELSKYGLKDTAIKPLLDFITSDKNNDPISEQIEELKKNPEQFAELLMFLNNKEDYKKAIGEKATFGKETNILRTLSLIPGKKEVKAGKQEPAEEKETLQLKYI